MLSVLVRIGRDTTLRYTANNVAVASIACAYDVGYKDKKRTQWVDASLWGKQAEGLTQYLTKGQQILIHADDVEVEQYEHNGKTGAKLKCRVIDLSFAGPKPEASPQQQTQPQVQQQQPQPAGDFDNSFDEDIPF